MTDIDRINHNRGPVGEASSQADASPDFLRFPDLASRALAGSVVWATDESFAERENLIMPHEPRFDPAEFGNKGQVYDGWETRRRRHDEIGGYDSAIVRLGVPGHVHGVVVDTAWFTGNYPPEVAVWGLTCDDLLSGDELGAVHDAEWFPLVERSAVLGDTRHAFAVHDDSPARDRRVTDVRLDIIPDGGVARLRVHGEPSPDPRFLTGTVDLAATENGGRVVDCSNMFYSSPDQIIGPGRAANMGGGWENARRRTGGNDHVTVRLAGESVVEWVEVDTSYFVFNAPGDIRLTGITPDGAEVPVVAETRVLPDTRHRFLVDDAAAGVPLRDIRLDVIPDGGVARLRVWGQLTDAGLDGIRRRW